MGSDHATLVTLGLPISKGIRGLQPALGTDVQCQPLRIISMAIEHMDTHT